MTRTGWTEVEWSGVELQSHHSVGDELFIALPSVQPSKVDVCRQLRLKEG